MTLLHKSPPLLPWYIETHSDLVGPNTNTGRGTEKNDHVMHETDTGGAILCYVPTADKINSIKPDQAIEYWSGSVGMSDREWSGRSTLVFLPKYLWHVKYIQVAIK